MDKLEEYYRNEGLEELRISQDSVHYLEFLTINRYLEKVLPKNAKILDPCAGTGVYSFYLAECGHRVTAGDLLEYNVNILKNKQEKQQSLDSVYVGDLKNLPQFEDESFDAVLCMGALYHGWDEKERRAALKESLRLLKKGGVLVATYINRLAVVMQNFTGDIDDMDDLLKFIENGNKGIFHTDTPEEISALMEEFPIEKTYHIGADGLGCFLYGVSDTISKKGFERFKEYHFLTCEEPSILGYSFHGAYFGKKK